VAVEGAVNGRAAREQARKSAMEAAGRKENQQEAPAETKTEAAKTEAAEIKSGKEAAPYKYDPKTEKFDKTTDEISKMREDDRGHYVEGKAAREEYRDIWHCGKEHGGELGGNQEHYDFADMDKGVGISMKTVMRPDLRASELAMRHEMKDLVRAKVEYTVDGGKNWSLLKPSLDIRVPKDQIVGAYGRLRALKDFGDQIGVKVKVFGY
jgi:hypothetical protein